MSEKNYTVPVYHALVEARFNPVAAMGDKYITGIQDRLRREGYTSFQYLEQHASWQIIRDDQSAGFVLNARWLTFHTTYYRTHQELIADFLHGLKAVHDVVCLDCIHWLGMRYLGVVWPRPGEAVDLYLVDRPYGMHFGAVPHSSYSESIFKTECGPPVSVGTLIARMYQATSTLGYPAGLVPHGLIPLSGFARTEAQPHAVIDTDHFVESRMSMNFENITEQLASLYAAIAHMFDATTTDHAKAVWA